MSQGFTSDPNITDNEITDAKLRDSAATSVIGRASGSPGDPADIVASADGQVLIRSGGSLTWGTITGAGVEGFKYDPNREPTTGLDTSISDNFIGGFQLTWRWANQSTATDTAELDTSYMAAVIGATDAYRVRWITAPSAADFCWTVKMSRNFTANTNNGGIIVLETGTEATPTSLSRLLNYQSTGVWVRQDHETSYAGAGETQDFNQQIHTWVSEVPVTFLQIRYVTSTKAMSGYFSEDGMTWRFMATRTLGADPISLGRYVSAKNASFNSLIRYHWVRGFTNGVNGASSAQYTDGKVGE